MKPPRTLSVVLAAVLQLLPVLRVALPAQTVAAAPAWAFVLRLTAGAVAFLGSHHAVSGATTIVAPYTVNGGTGIPYVRQLGLSGRAPGSWSANTATVNSSIFPLTPGLWLTNITGRIGGTPVWAGTSNITISVWEFSGNSGPSISQVFTVTITNAGPPGISTQPKGQTNSLGSNTTFSVTAFGAATLAYQWRFNAGAVPNATNNSYTRTNIQVTDAGSYTVVITNSLGSITSSIVSLGVKSPPVINSQPTNLSVALGSNATFSVSAAGSAPLGYQWRFNGANIPQATSSAYSIPSAQPANAGIYSVVLTNSLGTNFSSNATLTVVIPPSITTPPQNATVAAGAPVNFTVVAAGSVPLAYQWLKDGNGLAGATTSAYSLAGAQTGDAGSYTVVVTNLAGSVTGGPAILTVSSPPPPVTMQPAILGNRLVVSFNAQIGASYAVQSAASPGAWTILTNVTASLNPMTFSDSLTNTTRFYRILTSGD